MKRLEVVMHLSANEIRQKYRACRDGEEKTRWQVIWLLTRPDDPRTCARAAEATGLNVVSVRRVLARWNSHAAAGLRDGRRENCSPRLLSREQEDELKKALLGRPPDGGLWTGPKLVAYARDRFGVRAHPHTGWRWLVRFRFSPQVPRPRHPKAAGEDEKRGWKIRTPPSGAVPAVEAPGQAS